MGTYDEAVEKAARALDAHGYWRDPQVGGCCPACDHVYYERPPGAYMDPDLDWLRGAIDRHRAEAVLDAVADDLRAEALRDLADSIDPTGYGWTDVRSAKRFRQRIRDHADQITYRADEKETE